MKPIALSTIRKQNLAKVLDLLTLSPALTRQELANAANLSQMTMTNLVDYLKEQDVLHITPLQRSAADRPAQGRKAEAISLCGDHKAWLLVDISSLQFSMTLTGFDLSILLELHDDQRGEYLPRLENFLREGILQVQQMLGTRELLGVAVIAPGPYEINSDTIYNQRLPQLDNVKIKELFRRCMGDYEYYVDEDVKFAVRAFTDLIVLNQCEILYYLYIGEGVGGAAVHSGNMLRGQNATAGDAGHLLDRQGNTYESRLSTSVFANLLYLPETPSPEALQQLAQQYPARYDAALNHMAAVTAEMLHGVLWILDPTHIIIDCVYARPREDVFVQALSHHLEKQFAGENRKLPQLSPGTSGVSSVLRGAVHVLQKAWLDRVLA